MMSGQCSGGPGLEGDGRRRAHRRTAYCSVRRRGGLPGPSWGGDEQGAGGGPEQLVSCTPSQRPFVGTHNFFDGRRRAPAGWEMVGPDGSAYPTMVRAFQGGVRLGAARFGPGTDPRSAPRRGVDAPP